MRALIIGQAPQRSATPDMRPWDSHSGRRLAVMMGCTHEEMMAAFETDNLNRKLTGTNGKYDKFDKVEARQRAQMFQMNLRRYDLVLACGQQVAKIMEFPWLEFEQRRYRNKITYVAGMPHPGGTNMWWNNPDNRIRGTRVARMAWAYVREMS